MKEIRFSLLKGSQNRNKPAENLQKVPKTWNAENAQTGRAKTKRSPDRLWETASVCRRERRIVNSAIYRFNRAARQVGSSYLPLYAVDWRRFAQAPN